MYQSKIENIFIRQVVDSLQAETPFCFFEVKLNATFDWGTALTDSSNSRKAARSQLFRISVFARSPKSVLLWSDTHPGKY
jgi:hypothetical protein